MTLVPCSKSKVVARSGTCMILLEYPDSCYSVLRERNHLDDSDAVAQNRAPRLYQPMSPPMTTSPPSTAPEPTFWLMELGTTAAVMGNSTGAVLTTRTTLPEPGVSRTAKKGRSKPSSVYSSTTCLLLLGPWRSSMRALSGRPSVLR